MFIYLFFLIGLCDAMIYESSSDNFNNYLKKYNKKYDEYEHYYRYTVFKQNIEYINRENQRGRSYHLGINNFTDITKYEFRDMYLSNRQRYDTNTVEMPKLQHGPLPSSVDWRGSGYVTNVKDQGQCGSCWAFSAVGAIEGQHAKKTGDLVSLSEQNLVDCAYSYGCYGCDGGWPEAAMRYVKDNKGIDTEDAYPYNSNNNPCSYTNKSVGATVSGTVNITQGDMNALHRAIATVGPISVAIDAEDDFQFYKYGIYSSTYCSSVFLDHAVLAIGYGEKPNVYLQNGVFISAPSTGYIIIKNSWGSSWGMDGYIYFSTEINNMCGIAQAASYPKV